MLWLSVNILNTPRVEQVAMFLVPESTDPSKIREGIALDSTVQVSVEFKVLLLPCFFDLTESGRQPYLCDAAE
jgi:hypothetical protein